LGVKEKDLNLAIGQKLATLLKKNGFSVIMTRSCDTSVPLEKRIEAINQKIKADLLISIHANSAASCRASGIETFCLRPSLFTTAQRVHDSKCRIVINKCREIQYKKSEHLAKLIQNITVAAAKKVNPAVISRGVKFAVARMLLGIDFPGALIEVGFVTHEQEASLLKTDAYQSVIARGICTGILSYFKNS